MNHRILLASLLVAGITSAQNFDITDFSTATNLNLVPNALITGTTLRVNSSVISDRGAAWVTNPVPVLTGFDTTFAIQVTAPVAGGGDGMAFVIQNDPAATTKLGKWASAMGYGAFVGDPVGTAVQNSLVVEFDTYSGSFGGVPDLSGGKEISVHTGGTGDNSQSENFSIGRVDSPINFSDGQVHTIRVLYVPGTLSIFVDNPLVPTLTVPYDFQTGSTHILPNTPIGGLSLLPGGEAFIGFTAGNGGAWENHDVLAWSWTSFVTDPCYVGNVGATVGGPYDVLGVNGSPGSSTGRLVEVPLGAAFTVDVAQPPSNPNPANFVLLVDIGLPTPAGTFTFPGLGTFCSPPPVLSPGSTGLILSSSFGAGAIFPGALPTPYVLAFPLGLPIPLNLSFQAVIEDGVGLAITNTVILANG